MDAKLEIVTPVYAKDILDHRNGRNRPLSEAVVSRYAADMRDELWLNSGQPIIFDVNGQLLDGQHRLRAIVVSGKSVAMMVVRGAPTEGFKVIDGGKPRRLTDVLALEGVKHYVIVGGLARAAYAYAGRATIGYSPTKATLEAFIERHREDMVQAATLVGNVNRKGRFPAVPMAAVMYLANAGHRFDPEVAEFVEGVYEGSGLVKGDPRHTLREWYITHGNQGRTSMRTATLFAATARAWNAYSQGQTLKTIRQLESPTQDTLRIIGYEPALFNHVPDIQAQAAAVRFGGMAANPRQQEVKVGRSTGGRFVKLADLQKESAEQK